MQDEVNTKVVAIAIKGGKITAEVLDKALKKFVEEIEKAQKTASQPKAYRGKQSIKHLVAQNAAISNIEVTDGNIKSFQRTANKYGIDYALKKDTSEEPPRYIVFFKGRDVDVMTQAFKEFSARTVKQKDKPSLRRKLSREQEQSKAKHREKVNLTNMFTDVNEKVGTIAGEVGRTPSTWNGSIYTMIRGLSESVIVPIAGIIITFVLCYELISMITEKNNMRIKTLRKG